MKYGYCRISRPKQSIERQIRNIKAQYQDSVIVQEVFTRTRMDWREWQKLMHPLETHSGRTLARGAADEPAAAAAAQAIVTACGVLQTPTNALGFVFYGAAAAAYDELGLRAAQAEYDARAAQEFNTLTEYLRQVMVADEPEPIQVNWYC